jgi:alpha-beta hydrolase superfamily lysophospholipase
MKIKTPDQIELEVSKLPPINAPKAQIFFAHGYSVPKEGPANILLETAEALVKAGFEVILFNFRGHGDSSGAGQDVCINTGLIDLGSVFESFRNAALPFGFLGFSYGAAVVIEYIAKNRLSPSAVVFFSPALDMLKGSAEYENSLIGKFYRDSIKDGSLARDGFFVFPHNGFHGGDKIFSSYKEFHPAKDLSKIKNVLIIQGKNDQMLDFNLMKSLGEPAVEKYLVLDAVHGLTEEKPRAIQESLDWFNQKIKE